MKLGGRLDDAYRSWGNTRLPRMGRWFDVIPGLRTRVELRSRRVADVWHWYLLVIVPEGLL